MKKTITESQLRQIVKESIKKVLREYKEWDNSIEALARDLCDGFEDIKDYNSTLQALKDAISDGYSLEELWRMNNEDSGIVYDIISNYEDTGLDESRLCKKSAKRRKTLRESVEDFYAAEDDFGNVGEEGMVKSYDIGWANGVSNWEAEAANEGMTLQQYLKLWWENAGYENPFRWEKLGPGYGFHGDTILKLGNVVFKDIYGQLIIDEYPPQQV